MDYLNFDEPGFDHPCMWEEFAAPTDDEPTLDSFADEDRALRRLESPTYEELPDYDDGSWQWRD